MNQDEIDAVLNGHVPYYTEERLKAGSPPLTERETELRMSLAEFHAKSALASGQTPEPDLERAICHMAQAFAAIHLATLNELVSQHRDAQGTKH